MIPENSPAANPSLIDILERMLCSISLPERVPLYLPGEIYPLRSVPAPSCQEDTHPMHELAYVDDGAGTIVVESRKIALKQGEFLLIPLNRPHYMIADTEVACRVLWLGFEQTFTGIHTTSYVNGVRRVIDSIGIPSDDAVRNMINQVYDECANKVSYSDQMVKSYLLALCVYLCRPARYMADNEMKFAQCWKDKTAYKAITYMQQCYADINLSVADIARYLAMSTSHFSSHFRAVAGYSPYRYLILVRMQKAGQLLFTTTWPVDYICNAVGFQYPHHFSTTFRRIYGMTPTAFRKQASSGKIPVLPLIKQV